MTDCVLESLSDKQSWADVERLANFGATSGPTVVSDRRTIVNATGNLSGSRNEARYSAQHLLAADWLNVENTFLVLEQIADPLSRQPRRNTPLRRSLHIDVTAGPPPMLDGTAVAALEAQQQTDAIMGSMDLRALLEALTEDEGFTSYDLTKVLGVTRSNLANWRARPVEKLRLVNERRLRRIIYCWKLWLRLGDGQRLAEYLREGAVDGLTLLDLLERDDVNQDEMTAFISELVKRSKAVSLARLERRRHLAGLPGRMHGASEFV